MVSIPTATGNSAKALYHQVTFVALIDERSYAIIIFMEAAVNLLGQRGQERENIFIIGRSRESQVTTVTPTI